MYLTKINEYNIGVREIHYDITMACNNRCPYCYVLNELDNNKLYDQNVTDKVLKKINTYIDNNDFLFNFFIKGGEPFLVIDKVIDFYNKLNKINMFSIFTNLNFSETIFNKKIEYIKSKDIIILVSWHQSSDENNIKRNLKLLQENNIETEILLFLDKTNINEVYRISQWCLDNNFVYSLNNLRLEESLMFNDYNSSLYNIIKNNSHKHKYINDECQINDSYNKFIKCEIFSAYIDFYGDIKSNCGYNINKLEDMKYVICFNKTCNCNYDNFKEIIRYNNANI